MPVMLKQSPNLRRRDTRSRQHRQTVFRKPIDGGSLAAQSSLAPNQLALEKQFVSVKRDSRVAVAIAVVDRQ
jgi:hypothetical protein